MGKNIETTIHDYQIAINQELAQLPVPDFPASLYEPLQYSLQTKGKRIRPILTLMVGEILGADRASLMPAALAIETLHTYTLVHDDIMDNDDLRRGQPTVHKKWNTNTAILSGDAINTLAFRLLMETQSPNLQKIAIEFTDGMMEICEGQALDMEFERRSNVTLREYTTMISKKTACLLAMSCKIGALIAESDTSVIQALDTFAMKTGRAFQIQDDLLEILSNADKMGKSLGSDFAAGKKTYPLLLTLNDLSLSEQANFLTFLKKKSNIKEIREKFINSGSIEKAKQTVNQLLDEAQEALKNCPAELQKRLLTLTQYLQKRKS